MFDTELIFVVVGTVCSACICYLAVLAIQKAAKSDLPFVHAVRIESKMFSIAYNLDRDIAAAFEELAVIRDLHEANGRMSHALKSATQDYLMTKQQLEQTAQAELDLLANHAVQWGMSNLVRELYETMAGQYPSLGLLRLAD